MIIYHYTIGRKIPLIYESGHLKTSPKVPAPPEKPIVWLSSNPKYEYTALKIIQDQSTRQSRLMTFEENQRFGGGLCRFVFDSKEIGAVTWSVLKKKSRMKSSLIKSLEVRARSVGARPSEWWGVFKEVPISGVACEVFRDGCWIPYSPELIERYAGDSEFVVGMAGTTDELGIVVSDDDWAK